MKFVGLLSVIITGSLLIYAVNDFPAWGDARSRPNSYLSPHYITRAELETGVPNIVTAVLADYRGFDTMIETAVIFTAGIGIMAILRRRKPSNPSETESNPADGIDERPSRELGLIVRMCCVVLVPPLQLFGLYVVAHGHHSPGGGFQGGVILAASLILIALAFNLGAALRQFSDGFAHILANTGILIYAGTGLVCLFLGGNYLDYSALEVIFPGADRVMARSHAILIVEIGVALTVMSILFMIYAHLSSRGEMRKGL